MRTPPSHHLEFDERPIRFLTGAEFDIAAVGRNACTEIRLVMEPGEMSMVPWFEVVGEGDVVLARVNGRFVSIVGYGPAEAGW